MRVGDGKNVMVYDCSRSGCFNIHMRPKIEIFEQCFGVGKISMGDIDGTVERNELFLLMEWKNDQFAELKLAQLRYFEAISKVRINHEGSDRQQFSVFVVRGNAKTMEVWSYCEFIDGVQTHWIPASLEQVKRRFSEWYKSTSLLPPAAFARRTA